MAKALLLRALRDSFGHMVDGLESENLQVAVWSGEIHLENLSLKKDAFDGIDLPIEIKVGRVKSLRISVPWTRLGSEPVRVTIDGIYAYAILKNDPVAETTSPGTSSLESLSVKTADDFLSRRRLREKRRMLRWAALTEGEIDDEPTIDGAAGKAPKEGEEDAGFWSRLLAKVVDNLVVEIRHCHIRIEDEAQWTSRKFAFGLSMRKFSGTTCDAQGRTQFVDRASEATLLHRMVRCDDIALYWDSLDGRRFIHGDESWLSFLHTSEFSYPRSSHNYILKPCSPHVLVSKNDAPTSENPRWTFEVELSGVHVGLSRTQFEDVSHVYLAAESHIVKMSPNPRPLGAVSRNPRAWWKYAIRNVIVDLKEKSHNRDWLSLCKRVVKRSRYIQLYKRTKKAPWLEPLSEREKETLKQLEDDLDKNDVLAFRATALAELRAQRLKTNQSGANSTATTSQSAGSGVGGYLRSFLGSTVTQKSFELTAEEKAEIENAIDYLEAAQKTLVPEDTRNMVVRSTLKNATLTLWNATYQEIMMVAVEGDLLIETCVGPAWRTTFHLVSFELMDKFSPDTIFPVLISPKTSIVDSATGARGAVMTVGVDVKPTGKPEDIAVSVKVVPFKIILVPTFVAQLSKFFVISEETRLGEMATEAFTEWTESKQDDFMEALARRTLISVTVDIQDPVIACPLTVSKSAVDLHMIVLDLGHLRIESDDARLRIKRDEASLEDTERENLAIDAWKLKSEDVKAFLLPVKSVLQSSGGWTSIQEGNDDRVLFNDFDLNARLAVCITPKLLQVPRTRLSIAASALRLRAPPSLFRFASKLGTSWSRILAGTSSTTQQPAEVEPSQQDPILAIVSARSDAAVPLPPLLEVDMVVDALITTLSQEEENLPLARMELFNFNIRHVRLANGDVDSHMSLESLQVYDLYSKTPPILASSTFNASTPTMSPSFSSGEEETPAAGLPIERMISIKTMYRKDLTSIDARFNQLHINWNPETVLAYKNAYHNGHTVKSGQVAQLEEQLEEELIEREPTIMAPPPAPLPPAPKSKALPIVFSATLNALTLAMCKGEAGRVLAHCIVSNTRVEFSQLKGTTMLRFWLGNFKIFQPPAVDGSGGHVLDVPDSRPRLPSQEDAAKAEAFEFFSAVEGSHESLFAFEYISGGSFKSQQSADESFIGINISPARLVYQNQMMLEFFDYLSSGVMGTIVTKATDSLTTRTMEKYRVQLNWFSPILVFPAEATLTTNPHSGFEIVCAEIHASNMFEKPDGEEHFITNTFLDAQKLEILGFLPSPFGEHKSSKSSLVRHPVDLNLHVSSPLAIQSTLTVSGKVSAIEICVPRMQYFLFHRMMSENLLAEGAAPQGGSTASTPTSSGGGHVTYGYDRNDAPPSTFRVSIFFTTASLQVLEEPGWEIATFAMRRATLTFLREKPTDPTSTQLQVEVLDLVDDRPESKHRCFRHLILCDASNTEDRSRIHSFEVKYVGAEALVEIDLHMFRSVVLLDLFTNVLNFITTTEPEDSHLQQFQELTAESAQSHPLETKQQQPASETTSATVTPWKGTFRLRRASMFFVCDWADPATDVVVLGGDLDLEWRKREDGCASSWTGRISGCELYRAELPHAVRNATNEESSRTLHSVLVGHQITEPAEVSFQYMYELDSPNSRIHSRRVSFKMEQLENFFSISDIQTLLGVIDNMRAGDAPSLNQSQAAVAAVVPLVTDTVHEVNKLVGKALPPHKPPRPSSRRPQWEYFQLGTNTYAWNGSKMDRPPAETKARFSDLPVRQAARIARKRLENKNFTIEFQKNDFDIEFLEHDGFVTVGSVGKDSMAYGLVIPGDVLVAVNYTPVLTKSVASVNAIIAEERKSAIQSQAVSFTLHPMGCNDPLILKDALHFESTAVVLHVIDDTDKRDLPLAHLSFTKIDAFRNGSNVGHTIVSGANLLLAMHYHDPISGRWEMLMSPWTANLGIQFHSHGQVEANFETSNDLQFQLSDVFVRATSDAMRRVFNNPTSTAYSSSSSSISPTNAGKDRMPRGAHHLRNRTGLPLWYWQVHDDDDDQSSPEVQAEAVEKVRVESGEVLPFTFSHEKGNGTGTRRNYQKKKANRLRIILGDDSPWQPLPDIPVNLVHRGSVFLVPKAAAGPLIDRSTSSSEDNRVSSTDTPPPPAVTPSGATTAVVAIPSRPLRVAWEVTLDDGRLCLELRSFRRVKNTLRCPIQVLSVSPVSSSSSKPIAERIVIPPGGLVALPVITGDVSEIRIRPMFSSSTSQDTVASAEYLWSEPCYTELASQRGTSHVTCQPGPTSTGRAKPFFALVQVQVEEEDGATVRFTVYPPIIVQNQLPVALYSRLFSGRSVVGEDVVLGPGEFSQVNTLTVEGTTSFIAFRLRQAKEWSIAVRVERKKKVSSTPLEFRGGRSSRSDAASEQQAVATKRLEETTQLTIVDGDGTIVPLSVVQETTEYEGLRFMVYCGVWLVNRTELPLSYGYAQSKWSSTGAGTSCPQGVMLYASPEDSGGKLQVRISESNPSAAFSVSTPDGKARPIVVPGGSAWPNSFDLAVSVDVGGGDLFRTNVVTFAPRYVFLNRLAVSIAVRQLWEDMNGVPGTAPPSVLTVKPQAREPFWASSSTAIRPFRLEIRAFSQTATGGGLPAFETLWSSPFKLETLLEGRAVVPVELQIKSTKELFRFNMEVREDQIAGSLDIELTEWIARTNIPVTEDGDQDPQQEEEYVTVELKKKMLPKTVAKFLFPKVEVILRKDAAGKQKKTQPPPPPPPASTSPKHLPSSLSPRSSASAAAAAVAGGIKRPQSVAIKPHPPPPAPPPSTPSVPASQPRLPHAPQSQQQALGAGKPHPFPLPATHRRTATGESKEIARATVSRLEVVVGRRIDGFRELQLFIRELRVVDPTPGAAYHDAIEGIPAKLPPSSNPNANVRSNFFNLHIIQRGMVFEKFQMRLPGFKLKVDERFVLDLARFANDAVVGPLRGNAVDEDDMDCSALVRDILERRSDSTTLTATGSSSNSLSTAAGAGGVSSSSSASSSLIFFNKFYISAFEIRLWYNQLTKNKSSSLVSFGFFSKLNIRIENSKIRFNFLSLRKPFGSYNLYAGLIRDHYEREARSQIGGLLLNSIDVASASFAVADSFISKIVGTEIKSNEFRGETLSNDEIVTRYRRRLLLCTSLEEFMGKIVRNCAFDWSYNHTGLLNSRKALILGIVNRSEHEVTIKYTLTRGQNCYILPGGLTARQLGTDAVKIVPGSKVDWESSATCLLLAYGFLHDKVDITVRSNAFEARFEHIDSILRSKPGFSAAFLAKDVSKWLSWYVLIIENQVVV